MEIVRILLEARASMAEVTNSTGKTPLSLAAERGHVEVLHELLLKQAQVDQLNADGSTALHAAAHQTLGFGELVRSQACDSYSERRPP